MSKKKEIMSKEVVTGQMLTAFSSINCEKPIFVTTRTGRRIPVPCGQCIACLRKRRNSWAIRLDDESKHPRCVDQFGITLTYNSDSLPWLPLAVLQNKSYRYKQVSKDKYLLDVYRGVSPEQLRNRTAVSLAYPFDIECYIKRLRKWFDDYYPQFFIRYYIVSDYGELEGKRTGRAHYHGIIFVFANDIQAAEEFRRSSARFSICQKFREIAMEKWPYAERIYNSKKNIFIGKDYHTIDKGYTSYLGKYINKYEDSDAIGRKYIDTRIFCSRQSSKRQLGSIGFSSLLENNTYDYNRMLRELDYAVKNGTRFQPSILSQPLNGCYRKKLFENYFGFKFSRLAKWLEIKKYVQEVNDKTTLERQEYLDPNDPLEVLYIDEVTINVPHIYKRVKPYRKRASIYRPPKYTDFACVDYQLPNNPFTPLEICAFCRYLNFSNHQLDLYLSQFKGSGKYIILNYLVTRYLGDKSYFDRETFIKAIYSRKNVKNEIVRLKKFAEDYAKYHEKHNKYTDY